MRGLTSAWFWAAALSAQPAMAKEPEKPAKAADKPITDREVDAIDVATTPITDLNIRKDQIPQLLIDAQARPYDLTGHKRCSQLAATVGELDAILGFDLDLPQTASRRVSPGRMAQSVVGSFVPFRGIVREISGANDQQRKVQAAIQAGLVRRAFLKGVGEERGCRYPARSATREDWDRHLKLVQQAEEKDETGAQKVSASEQK